jgi:parallel beta-helix repeat protein
MKKTAVLIIILVIITVLSIFFLNGFLNPIKKEYKIIRIQSDGSVYPLTDLIQREGNTYTFTNNFYGQIVVDASNIIIDGAGYILYGQYNGTRTDSWVVGQGPQQNTSAIPWTIGIDLARQDCSNLTVTNLRISNFYIALYLWTSNNTIVDNIFADSIVGVLLSGDSNSLTHNYISNNEEGIFFGVNTPGNEPLNIVMNLNSFVENDVQFSGCFCEESNTDEAIHTWDDGERGNYWSDYQGIDSNNDGIGDTPYVIDVLNQDRYPLMEPTGNEE